MKLRYVSKKMISLIFLSSLLCVVEIASAQTIDGKSVTEFQANPKVVDPVDPDDDDDIIPIHPPTIGPLSINYASDISFGQHKKSNKDEIFYAKEDTVTIISSGEKKNYPNFVQVTDLRGTASGWVLSVRQNGQLKNAEGDLLEGGIMRMTAQSVVSQNNMPGVPTGLTVDQVLEADGSTFHPMLKAETKTGLGTWNVFLGISGQTTSGISLTVPKNIPQKAGVYTTSLTWSLQDAL